MFELGVFNDMIKDFLEITKDYPPDIGVTMETSPLEGYVTTGLTIPLKVLRLEFKKPEDNTDRMLAAKNKSVFRDAWLCEE